jgi:hypothetical protein
MMAPGCPYCAGATVGGCPRCEAITNNLPTGASVEPAMPRATIRFGTGEMTSLRTIDLGVRAGDLVEGKTYNITAPSVGIEPLPSRAERRSGRTASWRKRKQKMKGLRP